MQIPTRRADKLPRKKVDPYITSDKKTELEADLKYLKTVAMPREAKEVERLAQFGDFSENAAYQMAKGRLRGINARLFEIESFLAHAIIINKNTNTETVQVGHTVTLESGGKTLTFQILGATETNPGSGVISRHSPLGTKLLGQAIGDTIELELKDKKISYKILKIE